MKNKILHHYGISLVQLTIGIALTGIISSVLMRSLLVSQKAKKDFLVNQEVRELTNKIAVWLSNNKACENTFATMDPNGETGLKVIKDQDGNEMWNSDNDKYGTLGLQIEEMSLIDFAGMEDGSNYVPGEMGSTNLMISFSKVAGSNYEGREVQSKIRLSILTDSGSGEIIDCFTSESSVGSLWIRREGTPTDILYLNGRLGVGTDPTEGLDVVGAVQVENIAGQEMKLDVNTTEYEIEVNVDKPIVLRNISQGRRADFDAGFINYSRYLKLGNSGMSCTNPITGTLRYNGFALQYCRDGAWRTLSYE
ncbi:MAG: hypothetical protein CME62_13110 [Halobacteriovoraceae bacterium]|nr:hypothetical protein [Halobacteriovoraceae bacterium]